MQHYLRVQGSGYEVLYLVSEIKVRAEREMGQWLKETVGHSGGSPLYNERDLPESISYSDSHRYQTMATLPEEEFAQYLADVPCRLSFRSLLVRMTPREACETRPAAAPRRSQHVRMPW